MGKVARALKIEYRPISSLKPCARNPRIHSPKQIQQIAESIKTFGITNPILTDSEDSVLAGHGRLEAAKLLGIESVPTIRLDRMTQAEKRAYVIADNKLAENAGWDRQLLALEMRYVAELDIDFDLTVIGFDTAEIDLLVRDSNESGGDNVGEQIPPPSGPPVSQPGDLWILERHRLLCADARHRESFKRLLGKELAQAIIIDPPYNVKIAGNVCGRGAIQHREFPMATGEMSETEFIAFLRTIFEHLTACSIQGSLHFVFIDWRHAFELLSAARQTYSELKNLCVWVKDNGGMGSLYRSRHELIFLFKAGVAPHINNVELGRYGRYRSNVWEYAGLNTFRQDRLEELAMHPTVKPVALVADAILDCSQRNGVVLDCFGGSGTTLIGAERTGRRGYLMELDPLYVDVTIQRFQKITGKRAVHAVTGLTFTEMEQLRKERGDCAG
jgi:DNA modification methylase